MSVCGGFDISEQREGLCYYVTVSGDPSLRCHWPPGEGMSVSVRGGGGADPDSSCLKLTLTDPSWCHLTWAATTKNRKNRNFKRWTFYNFYLGIFIFGFQYKILIYIPYMQGRAEAQKWLQSIVSTWQRQINVISVGSVSRTIFISCPNSFLKRNKARMSSTYLQRLILHEKT